jgi:hypothetical protein
MENRLVNLEEMIFFRQQMLFFFNKFEKFSKIAARSSKVIQRPGRCISPGMSFSIKKKYLLTEKIHVAPCFSLCPNGITYLGGGWTVEAVGCIQIRLETKVTLFCCIVVIEGLLTKELKFNH